MALRIVPQSLEEAVAQSDHCIVLIDSMWRIEVPIFFGMLVSAAV